MSSNNGHGGLSAYHAFLQQKSQSGVASGFEPVFMPESLFDFQRALVTWAVRRGRAAIFAGTGLGKTIMQLTWAQNVVQQTGGRVLILAPVGVGGQTLKEGEKFGVPCHRSRDGQLDHTRITITNYEQLQQFRAEDFVGIVCDESSRLKHFGGATQKQVTKFISKLPYRLLCTATPAPNDFYELGTSAEALGELGYIDMLSRFFKQDDQKVRRMNDVMLARAAKSGSDYAKLAYRASQQTGAWHLKAHAERAFWRWVCSWARVCRTPSDLGYDDGPFQLPPLHERHHIVMPTSAPDGMLFTVAAFGLAEERAERRRTLTERCALVAELVQAHDCSVIWCHLNSEGDMLETMIPGSVQVQGSDSIEAKEQAVEWFCGNKCICNTPQCTCGYKSGHRVLISKSQILGYGLNLQHCAHVATFASHSWEQYYQSIRRCWRFGQTRPVTVDVISTDGEKYVRDNMLRKDAAAQEMFRRLVTHSNEALAVARIAPTQCRVEVPTWMQ